MSQAPLNEQELAHATQSKDGYVANINAVNRMAHEGKSFSGNERNCVFLNRGGGTFSSISALSGWDMPDDSRGLALMDWDHDGKIDFWASNRNAPRVRMMHNRLKDTGDWIGVKLTGETGKNRDAIGARVKAVLKDGRKVIRTVKAGEGFASQSSKLLHLGLGKGAEVLELEVTWSDGKKQSFSPPPINRYYTIQYGSEDITAMQFPEMEPRNSFTLPQVKELKSVSARLHFPIPAPNLRFQSLDKEKTSQFIEVSKGERPLLVCLWSQSCGVCRKELAMYVQEAQKIGKHFDLLALCIDKDPEDLVKAEEFLKSIKFPWRSGVADKATNLSLVSIFSHTLSSQADLPTPSSLLISSKGDVVSLYQGAQDLETMIDHSQAKKSETRWLDHAKKINLLYLPRLLMEHGNLNDTSDYVSRAHPILLAHKEYPLLLTWMADEFLKAGHHKHAAAYYQTASQIGQDNPVVLNNVAWVYATNKDPAMRNAALAVKYAMRSVQLTKGENLGYFDTLAAAYAENGDFEKAVGVITQALKRTDHKKSPDLAASLNKSLLLYQQRKPMRE